MRTRLTLDHDLTANGRHRVRFLLHVEAEAGHAMPRLPLNLGLVLDRSSSMSGRKLRAAREAAVFLVSQLRSDDRVAVVMYDDEVDVVSPPVAGDAREELADRIRRIRTGGTTNLAGGWQCGRDLIAGAAHGATLSRIILLTDGRANVGITNPSVLARMCADARAHDVSTTTIGFGERFNERLLAAMAEAGGGNTYYIEEPHQAAAVFGDEIAGLLEVGARNVRVRLRPGGAARVTRVFHGWPRTGTPAELTFDLGDLFARDPKMLLIEMEVAPTGARMEVARLIVSADVVVGDGRTEYREIALPVLADLEQPAHEDSDIRREVHHFDAAKARLDAIALRERGDLEGAAAVLHAAKRTLAREALHDPALRAEMTDLDGMERLFRAKRVGAKDLKYLHQRARDQHLARRSKADLIGRKWEDGDTDPNP